MLKGMMGGALMVALLAGGVFVWAKLGGHGDGFEYKNRSRDMSHIRTMDDGEQEHDHDDATQHSDGTSHDAEPGAGITLAETLGTTTTNTQEHEHSESMDHDMSYMTMGTTGIPSEPGQGAFAAISEIVQMLEAEPDTDWAKVDITALREHLVDMDMLITHADVTTADITGGIEMTVRLSGPGGGAASRMVPAHGPVLAGETGWESTVQMTDSTAIWRVVSADNVDQIRALGFFGLMATGDHHRSHHIGMARGAMVH